MFHDTYELRERFEAICWRKHPPDAELYIPVLKEVNAVLSGEPDFLRPHVTAGPHAGKPGGVLRLFTGIPTIVVPDLHARIDFIRSLVSQRDEAGLPYLDKLTEGSLQIVCVGDGFHSEGRGALRWRKAFDEFASLYKSHAHMDEEMKESLGLMEMVMLLKTAFPLHFHFLKGNHENIQNEKGGGNYPFRKYAYEGAMVLDYVKRFYGDEFLAEYYAFEKNLPLLAYGDNFVISHAEPKTFYDMESIVNYRENPHVVAGLTWTDNDEAEPGSVEKMLEHFLGPEQARNAYYFGGHRIVDDRFSLRAGGRYVQIHNPRKTIIAYLDPGKVFDPEEDVIELVQDGTIARCTEG
jgi:hypothetical protein